MLGIYIHFSVGWSFDHIFCCLLCTLVWHKQRNTRHTHSCMGEASCTTQHQLALTHTEKKKPTRVYSDIHKLNQTQNSTRPHKALSQTQTGNTHTHRRTQIHTCKLAVILISIESGWPETDKYVSHTGGSYVTEECRHGQLTILDQSLPRPSCLYSPAMVKIHGSHGECRRERDLYMNCECWCKFINMHQHCWGCCRQYNMTPCPDIIYSATI